MSGSEWLTGLEMGLIYGIVAIGIYLSFRVLDFPDLSCDGSFVLGAATSAILLKTGGHPAYALLMGCVAGGCAGFITGVLHTAFQITQLLSGILVAFMLYSVNLKVMGGIPNIALIQQATIFTDGNPLWILIAVAGLVWFLIARLLTSDFGLGLQSLGQNKRLALNGGINIQRMTLVGLVLSNALIGLGGALFSQHQGFADVSQGVGTVIVGLAAVMLGERLLPFRSQWWRLLACLLGSVVYRILIALALHGEWLGLATQDLNLITGLLLVGIMRMPQFRQFRRAEPC